MNIAKGFNLLLKGGFMLKCNLCGHDTISYKGNMCTTQIFKPKDDKE